MLLRDNLGVRMATGRDSRSMSDHVTIVAIGALVCSASFGFFSFHSLVGPAILCRVSHSQFYFNPPCRLKLVAMSSITFSIFGHLNECHSKVHH